MSKGIKKRYKFLILVLIVALVSGLVVGCSNTQKVLQTRRKAQ